MENPTSAAVARALLEIEAVKINVNDPFTWASGLRSPIYCDNRKTLSFPHIRKLIRVSLAQSVRENFSGADVVAGVATGAIAHGLMVAEELDMPFVYVRSSPKSHGLGNQVEGHLQKGKNVVVIEDLVSTGMSSLAAVEAIRQSGGVVTGMVAIFSYGFAVAEKSFHDADCRLFTLTTYQHLINEALHLGFLGETDLESLRQWRENPKQWADQFPDDYF